MEMIYFDNAATTWPKPSAVRASSVNFFSRYGANPGRSGHRMSMDTASQIYRCREEAAGLFNVSDPTHVIFTQNCTQGLNQIIKGVLNPGEHLLISDLEHNSVYRPAYQLGQEGKIQYNIVRTYPGNDDATIKSFSEAIRPNTRLILVTHCSNVFGFRLPIERLCSLAHRRGVLFGVDAAQSAGTFPIDCSQAGYDYVAMPGHKGLYGPTGTGLLLIGENTPFPSPLMEGGTGSVSRNPVQPQELPDLLESGTLNTFGILGLLGGIRFVRKVGIRQIARQEDALYQKLRRNLSAVPGVIVCGDTVSCRNAAPVLSFQVRGQTGEETASRLADMGFALRGGLHCSPLAHQKMGTLDRGTTRAGIGYFNTGEQVDALSNAVERIARNTR